MVTKLFGSMNPQNYKIKLSGKRTVFLNLKKIGRSIFIFSSIIDPLLLTSFFEVLSNELFYDTAFRQVVSIIFSPVNGLLTNQ